MIQEAVPCEVKELLENQQLNGVPVLLSTTSDLSLTGELRGHWIVVTRDNLAVVADGAEPRLVNHLPIDRVEKFRTQGAIGSGFLQAYVDEAWVDVARYSNTPGRPGSTSWPTSWKTCAPRARSIVHPEEAARHDPLPEVRPAAADGRRVVPAVPAAEGDRGAALAAHAAAVADGAGDVRADARRRGHGARAAEAAAVPGRRHPGQGRGRARMRRHC